MPKWWNWYTRTTQNRVAQVIRVRLSSWAHNKNLSRLGGGDFYFVKLFLFCDAYDARTGFRLLTDDMHGRLFSRCPSLFHVTYKPR